MLKPKKKITKQEIERDPVLEKTVELEQFIRRNAQKIGIGLGAVALVIIATIFIIKANKQKAMDASGKLGLAQMALQKNDVDDATLRLEEVIEDFSGTESAAAAHLMLAQLYMEKGDYESARFYYSDYVDKFDNELGKSAAYKALGVIAESNENWEEAKNCYQKAVKTATYEFQKQMAQLGLAAVNLELKDFVSAREILQEVKADDPEFNINSKVELLMGKLEVMEK
ncbi:MAG: tetratricopeptide repeat protein [Fidelibacterota bacterium]